MDDEGEGEGDVDSEEQSAKRAKLRKNPNVDTSFLPDREREEDERRQREELRQEWISKQEEMKQEEIEITYSFWDGSGHRKSVKVSRIQWASRAWPDHVEHAHGLFVSPIQCKKGDDIATFLEKCRQQFPELRGVSVDNLMYVKVRWTFICIRMAYRHRTGGFDYSARKLRLRKA